MFVSNGTIDRVMIWCTQHKGHMAHERGWALKALGEMVELCFASGATTEQIATTISAEIDKADQDAPAVPVHEDMREEVADVLVNLIVYCRLNSIDPERAVLSKLPVIEARQWEPDADGVLRRPDRINT